MPQTCYLHCTPIFKQLRKARWQGKIKRGQKSIKISAKVPDHVLAYPLRRNFQAQKATKFSLAVFPFAVF